MRPELLYNPLLFLERLGQKAARLRRLRRLRGTPASHLVTGHIDSLELLELLRDKPPTVIYDIGANVGSWTLLARAVFPAAQIHAFEPLSNHIAEFQKGTKALNRVHLHPVALGSKKDKMAIRVTSFSDASSFLEPNSCLPKDSNLDKVGEEIVAVECLDDYVSVGELPPPDLIKLDVQGYELEVLRGATKCLQQAKYIISEVSFVEYYSKQCLFEDIVAFLGEHKFRVCALAVRTHVGEPLSQTDVLFGRAE
jgi:FkbM family methyltransferase